MTIAPKKMNPTFHQQVVALIKRIPRGKVATYGQLAAMAGNPLAARQVVRVLHSSSNKEKLPWFRVVNGKGGISLPVGQGYELQKALLKKEGIKFGVTERIDLDRDGWSPRLSRK